MSLEFVPMLRRVVVNGQEKTAAPATVTRMVYDEESGKTLDALLQNVGGGAGLALEKLWENEAPAAEFAAQTVPLDLSQYELFLVTTMTQIKSDGTRGELSFVAFKNVSSALQVASPGGSGPLAATRQFQILENGINFYDARSSYNNHNNQISNAFLIPHQIYGIKTSPAGATGSAITWDDIYPVGSYYYSGDAEFDPNTAFGGTWEKVAENLALRQASAEHAVGSTFGEAEHVLTVDEMPSHSHTMPYTTGDGSSAGVGYQLGKKESQSWHTTVATGGGQAHNNVGPSLAVNIWRKTANGGKVAGQNKGGFSYSTEEQWTGKWWQDPETQNRYKIYSKIWVTGALGVGNNTIPLETSIKQPVSYGGTLFLQRGDTWPFPCALDQFSSGLSTINFPNNPGTAIISLGSGYADAVSVVKAHIWMEYIKEESTGGN